MRDSWADVGAEVIDILVYELFSRPFNGTSHDSVEVNPRNGGQPSNRHADELLDLSHEIGPKASVRL